MKILTKIIFTVCFSFLLITNISAKETAINGAAETEKLEISEQPQEVSKEKYSYVFMKGVDMSTAGAKITNLASTNGVVTDLMISGSPALNLYSESYYRLDPVQKKWFNYKQRSYYNNVGKIDIFHFAADFNSKNCTTSPVVRGCVRTDGVFSFVLKNESYSYADSTKKKLTSSTITTYHNSLTTKALYARYETRNYHTNGNLKSFNIVTRDVNDNPTYYEYNDYASNKVLINKRISYPKGNTTYLKYNAYGKLLSKRVSSATTYKLSYSEVNTYYSNKKLNEKKVSKYSNNKATSSLYYKYRSNGKIQYKKTMSFSNNYLTKMYTYAYNSKGELKSNKNGKAYRYITYIKKNSLIISKVERAQYSSKSKLGKASKVKASTLTKTFYRV